MLQIDQRINELQLRLARKRQLNQQLSSQIHSNVDRHTQQHHNGFGHHQISLYNRNPILRSSIGHSIHGQKSRPLSANINIAAVEPFQRNQEVIYHAIALQTDNLITILFANRLIPKIVLTMTLLVVKWIPNTKLYHSTQSLDQNNTKLLITRLK